MGLAAVVGMVAKVEMGFMTEVLLKVVYPMEMLIYLVNLVVVVEMIV